MTEAFDRASGIGGSDIPAILGISPWRSPFDVWLEKTRDPAWQPPAESAAMRLGKLLEPALATAYEQDHEGSRVERLGGFDTEPIWHDDHIVYVHIDGFALPPGDDPGGVWEGKSTRDDRDWQDGVPDYYEVQVRAYLATTGRAWCDVTVLFRAAGDIKHYRVEADPPTDSGIITLANRFWMERVLPGVPPDIDGTIAADRFLRSVHPRATEDAMVADEATDRIGVALAGIREELAVLEASERDAKNHIMSAMGEYGKVVGSSWQATWRNAKGATTTDWRLVASGYRGLLHQVEKALEAGRTAEALQLLTDNPPDGIMGLYTRTAEGTRPFVFRTL